MKVITLCISFHDRRKHKHVSKNKKILHFIFFQNIMAILTQKISTWSVKIVLVKNL